MDAVLLIERFSSKPNKSKPTKRMTARENYLNPHITSVSYSSEWLENMLAAFLAEHGTTVASTKTIQASRLLGLEKFNVTTYKDEWVNESDFTVAFRPLLILVVSCVEDVINDKGLSAPVPIILTQDYESPSLAIPDYSCHTKSTDAPFVLHHLLVEMETTSVLTETVIREILDEARPGGEWSSGKFSLASKQGTPVQQKAASIIRKAYLQMIPRTSIAESTSVAVSPLYHCISNYNESFIMKRSPDKGSILLAGPYGPKDVIPFLAALLLDQAIANSNSDLRQIEDSGTGRGGTGQNSGISGKPSTKKDVRMGANGMKTSRWDAGVHLSAITHDYDIRGFGGIKYIFSDERRMLTRWDPKYHATTASAPSHFYQPRGAAIAHITIVARLDSTAGETFLAKSDGAPWLVWKEIPLDDDHVHYAKTEVSMYNGPLASLQSSIVPALYGVFYDQEYRCVVLLMEYVGEALGSDHDWEEISPALRSQADDLHRRLLDVGVEHGDWEPRHICVLDGRMRVIDFSQSSFGEVS